MSKLASLALAAAVADNRTLPRAEQDRIVAAVIEMFRQEGEALRAEKAKSDAAWRETNARHAEQTIRTVAERDAMRHANGECACRSDLGRVGLTCLPADERAAILAAIEAKRAAKRAIAQRENAA